MPSKKLTEEQKQRARENARKWREANKEKKKEQNRKYREAHKVYFTEWRKQNVDRTKAIREVKKLVKSGISKVQAKARVVIPKTKKVTSELIERANIRFEKKERKERKPKVISQKTQPGEIIKLSEFIKSDYKYQAELKAWWSTALDTDVVLENNLNSLSAKEKKVAKSKIEDMRKYKAELVQDARSKDKNYRPIQLGKKPTNPELKYIFRQYKLNVRHYAGLAQFLADYKAEHGNFYTQIELNPIAIPSALVDVGISTFGTTTFLYSGKLSLNQQIANRMNQYIELHYEYGGRIRHENEKEEGFDYDMEVLNGSGIQLFSGTIIVTIKYAEGGCSQRGEVEKRIETEEGIFLVWSPKSRRNNCGIEILSKITGKRTVIGGSQKINPDKERKLSGIESEVEISPEKLIEIGARNGVTKIKIIDSEMTDLFEGGKYKLEEVEKMLTDGIEIILLRNNHYYLVISKANQMVCKRCNKHYWKDHDCSNLALKCNFCGSIYKEVHKCNPNRAGFHQVKEAKKESVKKAWKDIEEDEKNKLKYRLLAWDIESRDSEIEYNDMIDPKIEDGEIKWVTRYSRQIATLLSYSIREHNGVVKTHSFLGTDCVKKFLEFLFQSANEGKYFNLIAHNGGKFDCYFILNEIALNPDWNKYLDMLKGIKMKGPKIMNINWRNHNFIDSCCFMAGSLDYLTTAYACKKKKLVDGFRFGVNELTNEDILTFRKDLSPEQFLDWIQSEKNCDINLGKRLGFEHKAFNEMPFKEVEFTAKNVYDLIVNVEAEKYLEQYVKYCEMDCESLVELWTNFVKSEMKLLDTKQTRDKGIRFQNSFSKEVHEDIRNKRSSIIYIKDIERFPTIQAFTKQVFYAYNKVAVWEKVEKKKKDGTKISYNKIKEFTGHILEQLPEDAFNFIKRTAIGGISDVQYPGLHLGNLTLFDVVSLYPNNMIQPAPETILNEDGTPNMEFQQFGCGEISWTGEGEFIEDKVGFYLIENIVSPDKHSTTICDIPKYNEEKSSLDWRWKENPSAMIAASDIKRMRRNGYTFSITKGLYFAEKFNPFTEFVSIMIDEKKKQDVLNKTGDSTYNQALREVCKLMANALFGKMLEAKVEKNAKYLDSLDDKFFEDHPLETLGVAWKGERCLVKWEEQKKDAPIHLGAMILAYSRNQMMNFFDLVGRENIIATETDSMYVHKDKLKALKDSKHPIYRIGSDLGNMKLEDEKGATILNNCYFLGKKCYHVEFTSDEKEQFGEVIKPEKIKTKMAWKGVPKKKLTKEKYVELFNNDQVKFTGITQFKPRMFVDYKKDYVHGQGEAFCDVMISTNVRKTSKNTTERAYETYDFQGKKEEKNISA